MINHPLSLPKQSELYSDIIIRYAGQPEDQLLMAHVFEISYKQKEEEALTLPTLHELQCDYQIAQNTNPHDNPLQQNNDKPDHHFLIANVPPNKVSYYIPDRGKAIAGFCEFNREMITYDNEHQMDVMYIQNLYTITTPRCPVGKALMLECIQTAENLKVEAIALTAPFDDSRKWYMQQIGFLAFESAIYRPNAISSHVSRAIVLHRTLFDDAKNLILQPLEQLSVQTTDPTQFTHRNLR